MRRSRFQGLTNVVVFNYDMYLKSAVVIVLALFVPWPDSVGSLIRLGAVGAGYFLVASLLASHFIYDLSDLYRWSWFKSRFPNPRSLVNIHSGFDETTEQLSALFPDCSITTLDFYDPELMTEPSIQRARRRFPSDHSIAVESDCLPLADGAESLVCCLLAAHELREQQQKVAFLSEVRRSLHPEGHFVMLEHLRDPANFAVFGPGFVHFYSRDTWLAALSAAGLDIREEFTVTPFLRGFVCRVAPTAS